MLRAAPVLAGNELHAEGRETAASSCCVTLQKSFLELFLHLGTSELRWEQEDGDTHLNPGMLSTQHGD